MGLPLIDTNILDNANATVQIAKKHPVKFKNPMNEIKKLKCPNPSPPPYQNSNPKQQIFKRSPLMISSLAPTSSLYFLPPPLPIIPMVV